MQIIDKVPDNLKAPTFQAGFHLKKIRLKD